MPADTSTNYVNCVWNMHTPAGSSGTVTFNWLTTEGNWDFVNVFSGRDGAYLHYQWGKLSKPTG
eukprot:COSAG04_NODE_1552_length_6377_cov_253.592959_3_plen_64_part_00